MSIDTQNLRHAAASVRAFLKPEYGREIAMAADRIDAQAAEIERLRKALSDIADLFDTDEGCRSLPEYIAARAALSGEPNGA